MKNYNSLDEVLTYFMKLNKYVTQILLKINQAVISTDDTVTIQLENSNGDLFDYKVPSFNSLKRSINELDKQFRKLYLVRNIDNGTNIFGEQEVKEPNLIKGIEVPTQFYSSPNYFFESFLNPSLYIKIDVNDIRADSQFLYNRRLILNLDTDAKKTFFNNNLNKKTNLDYKLTLETLSKEGITYNIDNNVLNLPPIILQFSGNFDVIKIGLDTIQNDTHSIIKRYTLNTLYYSENLDETNTVQKILVAGDVLITTNGGSNYTVIAVDQSNNTVDLGLVDGYDTIPQGVDVLRIGSKVKGNKSFNIQVSTDEYQVIFLKQIDPLNHITSQSFGDGFAFNSSELFIETTDGKVLLPDYYLKNVEDYSKLFKGIIKENSLSTISVIKPDPPILKEENFKVHIINKQTQDLKTLTLKKDIIERRDLLEDKKNALNDAINSDRKKIEFNGPFLETETLEIVSERLQSNVTKKISTIAEIISLKGDIKTQAEQILKYSTLISPKVVIDGAWDIPVPKYDINTGIQHATHFKIRATYLTSTDDENSNTSIPITLNNGTTTILTVPTFNLYKTQKRNLVYDTNGNLVLESLNLSDPQYRPINQLPQGIPINPLSGEKVQIEVSTCIETIGNNEISSDWSNPVIISTPVDLIPVIKQVSYIDNKLQYYYEVDNRNDDVDILMMKCDLLEKHLSKIDTFMRNNQRGTIKYIITDTDFNNKYINLNNIIPYPIQGPDDLSVYIVGGLRGIRGTDYQILNNSVLTWDGYVFEERMASGDELVLAYSYGNLL